MTDPTQNHAPKSDAPRPARLIGYAVLAFLIIMVILLATGVVNFEQRGFF